MNNKKTFDTYEYQLALGANIKNPTATVTALSFSPSKGTTVRIGDTDYTVTLQGVKFTRKIYEPGLIEAEVSMDAVPDVKDVNDVFTMRYAELTIVNKTEGVADDNRNTKIAKNYFVYMVNPQIVMNSDTPEMFVKLTIHSMDKLMTLDKYSQVFTSRKLGDILDYQAKTFGFQSVLFDTNTGCLRNLRYPIKGTARDLKDNSKELGDSAEFIQPYLVQYNETFYDFMVRTANRCGEFLLFEDGTLWLGLPVTEEKDMEKIPSYYSITFSDYSDRPLTVQTYTRDSMKDGNGDVKNIGLNMGIVKKDSAGFPTDAFPGFPAYNSELAQDEYTYPLYKGYWSSLTHEMGFNSIADVPIPVMFSLLKAELKNTQTDIILNLIDFGVAFVAEWGKLGFFAAKDALFNNWDRNKQFIDPIKDKKEQYDGHAVQFGSVKEDGWTTVRYYADIRQFEEAQQQKIICIDMGTSYTDVRLGETIKVEGLPDKYVVIEIRQISNQAWEHDYKKFGDEEATDYYTERQSQVIYAIPVMKNVFNKETAMPPVAPVSVVRKAGPQTAFVVDNNDPKHQGRVRIAYPWQSTVPARRMELYDAEGELALATSAVDASNEKIKELKELLLKLRNAKAALKDAKSLDDKQKEDRIAELEKQIAELDKEIAELELPEDGEWSFHDGHLMNDDDETSMTCFEYIKRLTQQEKLKRLQTRRWVLDIERRVLQDEEVDIDAEIEKLEKEIGTTSEEILTKAKQAKADAEEKLRKTKIEVRNKIEDWNDELKEQASPWVRVATPMATTGGGTYFKPRVGDEVLVNYDNDNVERPYVVGSLFSKNVPTPEQGLNRTATSNDLMKEPSTTIMSPNGHHIIFKDPAEGSAFLSGIQGGVGMAASIVNTAADISWGKDCTGGIHIGDRYGIYELAMSSHERKISISSPMGDVTVDAFSGISLTAPNGDIKISGKNVTIEAGNNIEITSGNNIQYPVEGHPKKRYKVLNGIKAAVTSMIGSGVEFAAGYIDISFARTMAEVFLRPIEGTNCIKSKRYLMLEAGKGKAHIPEERYAVKERDGISSEQDFFNNLMDCVEAINTRCDDIVRRYKVLWDDAVEKQLVWLEVTKLMNDDNKDTVDPKLKGWKADFTKDWEDVFKESDFENKLRAGTVSVEGWGEYKTPDEKKKKLNECANAFARAVFSINACYNSFMNLFNTPVRNPEIPIMDALLKKCFDDTKMQRGREWTNTYIDDGNKPKERFIKVRINEVKDDPFVSKMKGYKRYLAAYFIAEVASKEDFALPKPSGWAAVPAFMADPFGMWGGRGKYLKIHYEKKDLKEDRLALPYYWQQFVGNMRKFDTWIGRAAADALITPIQTALQLNQELTNHSDKVYKNIWQQIGDRKVWNDRPDGLILLSDRKDVTRAFESGKWSSSRNENRGNWKYLTEYLLRVM